MALILKWRKIILGDNMNKGKLFIIATPIGNMKDITFRAVEVLEQLDLLLCEDTRETAKLLNYYKIKKKLISNNEKNEHENIDKVLKFLQEGKQVGLVVDRGTPLVSDPGFKIVQQAIINGYEAQTIPGASAFLTVLPISGFPIHNFLFIGFPDKKKGSRIKQLEKLKKYECAIVFYETSRRIERFLGEIREILGNREIIISREITKRYETHYRGTINEVLPSLENIKGEIVLIVAGEENHQVFNEEELKTKMKLLIKKGKSKSEAVKTIALETNVEKNKLYKLIHRDKGE